MAAETQWKWVGFLVVLLVLNFALRVGLGLGTLAPDLLVVAFLLLAREVKPGTAAGFGVLFGLLQGAVNYTVGATSVALALLGYLAARSREVIAGEGPVMLALYLLAGKWLYDALVYAGLATTGAQGPVSALLGLSLIGALYAALVGVAAVAAYRALP